MGQREKAVDFVPKKISLMFFLLNHSRILFQSVAQRHGMFASCDRLMALATNSTRGQLPASRAVKPWEGCSLGAARL